MLHVARTEIYISENMFEKGEFWLGPKRKSTSGSVCVYVCVYTYTCICTKIHRLLCSCLLKCNRFHNLGSSIFTQKLETNSIDTATCYVEAVTLLLEFWTRWMHQRRNKVSLPQPHTTLLCSLAPIEDNQKGQRNSLNNRSHFFHINWKALLYLCPAIVLINEKRQFFD